jgi:hypothetical protein
VSTATTTRPANTVSTGTIPWGASGELRRRRRRSFIDSIVAHRATAAAPLSTR